MKLQIIKTGKGYVAVNEQIPHQDHNMKTDDEGKWVISLYDSWIGTLSQEYRGLWRIRWKVSDSVGYLLSEPQSPENYRMIVATDTSFKLEGIAQFELESNIFKEAYRELDKLNLEPLNSHEIIILEQGFLRGYKVAKEKGCYTEEDLKEAIRLSYGHAKHSKLSVGDVEGKVINIIKQPKQLVGIEVETEIVSKTKVWETGNTSAWQESIPKINDGLLTVKQYYYE